MAYALVGSIGAVSSSLSNITSITPVFAQPTTAGNLLVAWMTASGAGATISVSPAGYVQSSAGFAGVSYGF